MVLSFLPTRLLQLMIVRVPLHAGLDQGYHTITVTYNTISFTYNTITVTYNTITVITVAYNTITITP